jgi:predicted SprT family Zn-dependent metalloprotease
MDKNLTPSELGELVQDAAHITWAKLRKNYPVIMPTVPKIVYNKRLKTTAGRAFLESQHIDLSIDLLWSNTRTMLDIIIPHEFSHLVAYTMFADMGMFNHQICVEMLYFE